MKKLILNLALRLSCLSVLAVSILSANTAPANAASAKAAKSTKSSILQTQIEPYLESQDTSQQLQSVEDLLARAVNPDPGSLPVSIDSIPLWAATDGTLLKDSGVFIDGSNNVTGINDLYATTIYGTIAGTIASAHSFIDALQGDVTGYQDSTVVSNVSATATVGNGVTTAAAVANATTIVETATTIATPDTLVLRDGTGSFSGNIISANSFIGDVTGAASLNVLKTGDTITGNVFITSPASLVATVTGNLTGDVTGDLTGSVIGAASLNVLKTGDTITGNVFITSPASLVATVTGNVIGNVTGGLTGNADTATLAVNVTNVNSKTAIAVASATTMVESATSNALINTLVKRDSDGNFSANRIYLTDSTIDAANQVPTKAYVLTAAALGIVPHDPARTYSGTNIALTGDPSPVDGVTLVTGDRILLNGQTDPIQNGLWLINTGGAWTRPTDFDEPGEASGAYVLISEGTQWGGSSWLCTTPNADIDVDPINFAQFTPPGTTTAQNVGDGAGEIFRDKTGSPTEYLNLRTLKSVPGSNITVSTVGNTVQIATTNPIIANITGDIAGDVAGDVTGNLAGSMIGTVTLSNGSAAAPSLSFVVDSNTGIFHAATDDNTLRFATNGIEHMSIDSVGTVTITQFTSAGVVHNTSAGALLSSLIVDSDITPATITNASISVSAGIADTKLATINSIGKVTNLATTATAINAPYAIVARDMNGTFTATKIYSDLVGSVTGVFTGIINIGDGTIINAKLATVSATQNNNYIVARDSVGTFTAIGITATNFYGALTGAASANVLKAGDTMTGPLVANVTGNLAGSMIGTVTLSNGSAAAPSLSFVVDSNTGIFHAATDDNTLRFATNGIEHMSIDSVGTVTITQFTSAGVVHNSSAGALLSSLIVDNDIADNTISGLKITDATITNAKLVTAVASINTLGAIVARDSVGTFTATKIYSDLVGSVTGVFTGIINIGDSTITNAKLATISATQNNNYIVARDSVGTFTAIGITATNFYGALNGNVTGNVTGNISGGTLSGSTATVTGLSTGVVHSDGSGLLSSSNIIATDITDGIITGGTAGLGVKIAATTITDANIATAAAIANSKLAGGPTTVNAADKIVLRDSSGSFGAGTITHALGSQNLPSITFTSDPNTGIYRPTDDSIGFVGNGIEVMRTTQNQLITNLGFVLTPSVVTEATDSYIPVSSLGFPKFGYDMLADRSSLLVNFTNPASSFLTVGLRANGSFPNLVKGQLFTLYVTTPNASDKTLSVQYYNQNDSGAGYTYPIIMNRNASITFMFNDSAYPYWSVVSASSDRQGYRVSTMDGSATEPAYTFSGDLNTGIYHPADDTIGFSAGGAPRMTIDATAPTVAINEFTAAGVVHNAITTGALSSSLIVNADVAAAAAIVGSKLADTSITYAKLTPAPATSGTSNIVLRDGSGNFSAGTITAALTGAASANVLKIGDTMTGPLTFPTGVSAPSITFAGHTDTGIYEYGGGTISFKANDTEAIRMTPNGILTRDGSEGLPSISFISDNNTGIYHPTPTNTMGFVAGGVEVMRTTTVSVQIKGALDYSMTTSYPNNVPTYAQLYLYDNSPAYIYSELIKDLDVTLLGNTPGRTQIISIKNTTAGSTQTIGFYQPDGTTLIFAGEVISPNQIITFVLFCSYTTSLSDRWHLLYKY